MKDDKVKNNKTNFSTSEKSCKTCKNESDYGEWVCDMCVGFSNYERK